MSQAEPNMVLIIIASQISSQSLRQSLFIGKARFTFTNTTQNAQHDTPQPPTDAAH
jgi:hypothetical protein